MGMFDYVQLKGPQFVCAEGHSLQDEEFQTKDFGRWLNVIEISDHLQGDIGDDLKPTEFTGRVHVYGECRKCPAFVQKGTGNMLGCDIDFHIEIDRGRVIGVERTFQQTEEWLRQQPWAEDAEGPFTWDRANLRQEEIWRESYEKRLTPQ